MKPWEKYQSNNTVVADGPWNKYAKNPIAPVEPMFANKEEADAAQLQARKDQNTAEFNASPLAIVNKTLNMISSPAMNASLGNIPDIVSKATTGKPYVDPDAQMKFLTEPLGMAGGASGVAVARVGNAMKAVPSIVEKGFMSLPFLQKAAAVGKSAAQGAAGMATQLPTQDNLGDNVKQYAEQVGTGALLGPVLETGLKSAIGVKNLFKPIEDKLFDAYNYVFGVKGKIPQNLKTAKTDTIAKVKAIQDNTPSEMENPLTGDMFTTPSNRYETAIAHTEAKKNIWKKVTDLSKGATEANAKIDLPKVVAKSLKDTISGFGDIATDSTKKATVDAIKKQAELISAKGFISPTQSETFMKSLFDDIKAVRQSGQPVDYSMKDFYSNLQKNLGNETDDVISNTLEKYGYKDARREYAIAKSSEKEILAAANKFIKEQGKPEGVIHPITNMWALNDILHSAITGNPSGIVRGITVKTASKLLDFMKNPDNKVRMIFDLAKKIPSKVTPEYFKPVKAEVVNNERLGLPAPTDITEAMTKAQPIRPIMTSKYESPYSKAQSIQETIYAPKQPTQAEIDFVNSFDPKRSTPKTRAELNRILNEYNIPSPKEVSNKSGSKTVIPSKGSKLEVKIYPYRGKQTDFARQLEEQNKNIQDVPLHPAKDAKAKLEKIIPAEKPAKITVNEPKVIPKKNIISEAEAGRNPLDEQKVGLEADPFIIKAEREKAAFLKEQGIKERNDARAFIKDIKGKLSTKHLTDSDVLYGEFEPLRGDKKLFSPTGAQADKIVTEIARKHPQMFDKPIEELRGEDLIQAYQKAMSKVGRVIPKSKGIMGKTLGAGAIGAVAVGSANNADAAPSMPFTMKEEGFRGSIYKDSLGHKTVGHGFNIADPSVRKYIPIAVLSGLRPLSKKESEKIFQKIYPNAIKDAKSFAGSSWNKMTDAQQTALSDMAYQLGINKLNGFKDMRKAILSGDFKKASREVLNSNYAKQVPNRAKRVSEMMK